MGMGSSEKNQRQILSEKAQRARGEGTTASFFSRSCQATIPRNCSLLQPLWVIGGSIWCLSMLLPFFFFFLRGNTQGGQIQASNQSGADRFCLLLFWRVRRKL